jgi:chromosome segregation ATPase
MAVAPCSDPDGQLGEMVAHLVGRNRTLIGHIDRIATAVSELAQDARARQSATHKTLGAIREQGQHDVLTVRTEMHGRLDATGQRFDELEERVSRLERTLDALRADVTGLQNAFLDARQSSLEARLRPDGAIDPAAKT